MRRVLPDAFDPRPSPIVDDAPLVQATVTVPVPSRFVDALATTGSYEPKARAAVLMVQLLVTVALTPRFAVAVAAVAGALKLAATMAIPLTVAANPRNVFARIALSPRLHVRLVVTLTATKPLDGTLWYSMALHGRGQAIPKMRHRYQTTCGQALKTDV